MGTQQRIAHNLDILEFSKSEGTRGKSFQYVPGHHGVSVILLGLGEGGGGAQRLRPRAPRQLSHSLFHITLTVVVNFE